MHCPDPSGVSNGVSESLQEAGFSGMRGKCSHTLNQMAKKTRLLFPFIFKMVAKPLMGAVIGWLSGAKWEMIQFENPHYPILTGIYAGTGAAIGGVLGCVWAFSDCKKCGVKVLAIDSKK